MSTSALLALGTAHAEDPAPLAAPAPSTAELLKRLEQLEQSNQELKKRLEAVAREGGACYQGILYEVPADRAKECRKLLLDRGLSGGVMYPSPSP